MIVNNQGGMADSIPNPFRGRTIEPAEVKAVGSLWTRYPLSSTVSLRRPASTNSPHVQALNLQSPRPWNVGLKPERPKWIRGNDSKGFFWNRHLMNIFGMRNYAPEFTRGISISTSLT